MAAPRGSRGPGIEPTAEQRAIQLAEQRSIIVRANAGAAKTTTLALRIANALENGTSPEQILALTFTAPACRALADALKKVGVPYAVARRLQIRTFDHFSATVLLGIERRPVSVKSTPEALAPSVWQALESLDMSADDGIVERFLDTSVRLKGTLGRDVLRWEGIRLAEDSAEDLGVEFELLRLFDAYERIRYPRLDGVDRPRFRGEFDATYDLARLLADPETDTPIAEIPGWPRGAAHLLVDEMHDLNLATFTILKALLENTGTRFCGVGDFDQVVHGTHGAEQRFMDANVELGSGRRVTQFPLTASRRFGAAVAKVAGRLAQKAYASDAAHATVVDCRQYSAGGANAEAEAVAQALHWKTKPGARLADFAILLRHPHQSVLLENALIAAGLPYETLGFERYVLQPEVLLVRALLAVALHDFAALESVATRRRLVRSVVFFCGVELSHDESEDETMSERLNEAVEYIASDASSLGAFFEHQVLERGDPAMTKRLRAAIAVAREVQGPEMFPRLLEALGMRSLVSQVFVERARRRDAMAYMNGLAQAAASFSSAKGFFASLNRAENLVVETRNAQKDAIRNAALKKSTLTLATVPAVKGLEYEHVLIPYLARGVFPAEAADPVEERNLFYVGITRARSALTLLVDARAPSPFVAMAGLEAIID